MELIGLLCMLIIIVTYFGSFGVEHIPKEIKIFINRKNKKPNIFRIQVYDSIMCGYVCIGFIDFMLKGKTLTEYRNLFFTKLFYEQYLKMDAFNKTPSIYPNLNAIPSNEQ